MSPTGTARTFHSILVGTFFLCGCEAAGEMRAAMADLQVFIRSFEERGIQGIARVEVSGALGTLQVSAGLLEYPELFAIETHRAMVTLLETYPRSNDILRIRTALLSSAGAGPVSVTSTRTVNTWRSTELNFHRSGFLPGAPITRPLGERELVLTLDSEEFCGLSGTLEMHEYDSNTVGSGILIERCDDAEVSGAGGSYDLRIVRGADYDAGFAALVDIRRQDDPTSESTCDEWGVCTCLISGTDASEGPTICRFLDLTVRGGWTLAEAPRASP